MKKWIILALCLMLALPAFALAEEEKVLNLLTWETYITDGVIAAFEQETGIKVVYAPMETNEDMLLKLSQSGGGEYDLVLGSDYALSILRKEGLIQPLNKEKLTNYANLDEHYLGQYFDPESAYVIPYMAGTPTIVYDPAKVGFEITGYEDLWNPALQDSIVMIDDARNVVGITLKTMGKSFNETDPEVLNAAKEKLMSLLPNIRLFDYNTPYTAIISGEASVGYLFTPQTFLVLSERPDLEVVYPKEGVGFGIDGLAIPAKAAHVDNAHLFLDFLMRPEVAVENVMWNTYLCVNKEAVSLLAPEYLESPAVNIPEELLASAEFIMDVGETETTFQEIYTAFKLQ